jgi:hypothetical protein
VPDLEPVSKTSEKGPQRLEERTRGSRNGKVATSGDAYERKANKREETEVGRRKRMKGIKRKEAETEERKEKKAGKWQGKEEQQTTRSLHLSFLPGLGCEGEGIVATLRTSFLCNCLRLG